MLSLVSYSPASQASEGVRSLKSVSECERWMMGMAKTLSATERAALEAKNSIGKEVDSAHDTDQNDPSPAEHELVTEKFFKQNWVTLLGVNSHINTNIRGSFRKILNEEPELTERVLGTEESKSLLGIHAYRYQPEPTNGPTTVNSDAEYCGISDRAHGYCWGYSTMVRYFHTLAFYDSNLPKFKTTAEYLRVIDKVLSGNATLIPGYANFRELSLVPEYELYLKLNAMELWKSRAVRFPSLRIFRNATDAMSEDDEIKFVNELKMRLDRNEMPKIIFSSLIPSETILGMNTDIHVVLANGVETRDNGNIRIHLWDINFYAETLIREPKYLEITPDHRIHYEPWYEPKAKYAAKSDLVASIQFSPENDAENIGMIRSLRAFCKKYPAYCK